MTHDEYTPRMRALDRIARSISEHQAVKREGAVGSTCRNRNCNGVIFLTLNDRYGHQAVVLANDLSSELRWQLDTAGEDAAETGQLPTEEVLANIRSECLVLATAPEPHAAVALAVQVRNAKADALIAAAEDAQSRGDIGKEGGVEAGTYLAARAKQILDDEMFEFPHSADTDPDADPRLAPAVNEFRRTMARHGSLTSIRPVRDAMIAALAAADAAKDTK